jgi:hypothetical protein
MIAKDKAPHIHAFACSFKNWAMSIVRARIGRNAPRFSENVHARDASFASRYMKSNIFSDKLPERAGQ